MHQYYVLVGDAGRTTRACRSNVRAYVYYNILSAHSGGRACRAPAPGKAGRPIGYRKYKHDYGGRWYVYVYMVFLGGRGGRPMGRVGMHLVCIMTLTGPKLTTLGL